MVITCAFVLSLSGKFYNVVSFTADSRLEARERAEKIANYDHGPAPLDWICYGRDNDDVISKGVYQPKEFEI